MFYIIWFNIISRKWSYLIVKMKDMVHIERKQKVSREHIANLSPNQKFNFSFFLILVEKYLNLVWQSFYLVIFNSTIIIPPPTIHRRTGKAFRGRADLILPQYGWWKYHKRTNLQKNCPNIYLILPKYDKISNSRGGSCPPAPMSRTPMPLECPLP